MTPDVLYRVRGRRHNEELRYSLRSLANVEHGEVWIVGQAPPWVTGVQVIEGGMLRTKWHNLVADLHKACVVLTGRTLILMDDDFYVLGKGPIPMLYRGSLREHIEATAGSYQRTLQNTADYLKQWGVHRPLSYELHVPMVIDADQMAEVLAPVVGQALQARTLYGNLVGPVGSMALDVKARRGKPLSTGRWLSSQGWFGAIADRLTTALPERSAYEL